MYSFYFELKFGVNSSLIGIVSMQAGVLVSSHSIMLKEEKPMEVDRSMKFSLEFDKDCSSQFIKLNAFDCIS